MDTKISSSFWSHPDIEQATPEIRLAACWLLTNDRLSHCGYAQVSENRFAFETGLPRETLARAFEALPDTFVRTAKGYWIPSFIRHQFGSGNSLARSNMRVPIGKAVAACPLEIIEKVRTSYPELSALIASFVSTENPPSFEALTEGSQRDAQAQEKRREEKSREEQRRVEKSRVKGGVGESASGSKRRTAKPGNVLPADLGQEGERMIVVGTLVRRRPNTAWSPAEVEAFRGACLDRLSSEDFESQLQPLRQFYGASIPREKDFRRRELLTLLNHWPGELDKATAWVRDNTDTSLAFGN
jgi:hypothetical protein